MGTGQGACADEHKERAESARKERFRNNSENVVITHIVYSIDQLELFIESNPSLTKVQWSRLEATIKQLKVLI